MADTRVPFPRHGRRLFLADLHLDGTPTPRARDFHALLKRAAEEASATPTELYILGDLFEFWEEYHREVAARYEADLAALEAACRAGVALVLLSGNRDFAYGHYVQKRLGARLFHDGDLVTLDDSRRLWLEHGDLLCTQDKRYLRYRRWVRSWPVRLGVRMLPWSTVRGFVARVSDNARADKARKDPAVFEVDLEAARGRLERYGCQVLLCGHTHRPQATDLGAGRRLIVLPSWCDVRAGYAERGGVLTPVCFSPDGTSHHATPTGEPLPELPEKKRRLN